MRSRAYREDQPDPQTPSGTSKEVVDAPSEDIVVAGVLALLHGPGRGPAPRIWVKRGIVHLAKDGQHRRHTGDWCAATREDWAGEIEPDHLRPWHVRAHIEGRAIIGAESPAVTDLIVWDVDAHPPAAELRCRWCGIAHVVMGPLHEALKRARCPKWPIPGSPCPDCGKPVTAQMAAPSWPSECACPAEHEHAPSDEEIAAYRAEAKAKATALVAWCAEKHMPHVAVRSPRHGWHVWARWPEVLPREELAKVARSVLVHVLGEGVADVDVWPASIPLRLPCGPSQRVAVEGTEVRGRKHKWEEAHRWLRSLSDSECCDSGAQHNKSRLVLDAAPNTEAPQPAWQQRTGTVIPASVVSDAHASGPPDGDIGAGVLSEIKAPSPTVSSARPLHPGARARASRDTIVRRQRTSSITAASRPPLPATIDPGDPDAAMASLPDRDIDVQIGEMKMRTGDELLVAARAYWFDGPRGSRYDAVLTIATVFALHCRLERDDVLNAMARWCERHRIHPASRRDTDREVRAHYRRWHREWDHPRVPRAAWVEPSDEDRAVAAMITSDRRARDAVARLAAYCRHNGPDVTITVSFLSALAPGSITISGVRRRLGQYVRDLLEEAGILALVKAHSAARTSLSGVGSGRVYRYHAERAAQIAAHGRSSVGEDDTKDLHPSVAHAVRAIRAHLAGHAPGARVDLRASTLDALCGGNTVTVDGKRVRAAQLARAWLVERGEVVQNGYRYFVPSPGPRDSEG